MIKQFFTLFLSLVLSIGAVQAQQTLSVRINSATDDFEEWLGTIPVNGVTVGSLDEGSSDLELGQESAAANAQMVGMRFNGITIPNGSIITKAYIQFTVDATSKNTDPCNLKLFGEASDNATTFDGTKPFNITSRPKNATVVNWNIPAGTWKTVGAAGADERSSDIKSVIQEIINRKGWVSGNSLAIYITGTGVREAESFDGSPTQAPQLVIEFVAPKTLSVRVNANEDDLEEILPGLPLNNFKVGDADAGSSDLELGQESALNNAQLVGLRFKNITIPKGAVIKQANITFTVDATNKNTDPSQVAIRAELADNPVAFDATKTFNLSSRPKTPDSIVWSIPATSWKTVGEAGADQTSTDISSLLQTLIDRNGWANGNAMAFYLNGKGVREAESHDGSPAQAPLLTIQYYDVAAFSKRIAANDDDMEEWIAGAPLNGVVDGQCDAGSSDLELGQESAAANSQLVGMRFTGVDVPQGAIVTNAYVQFTVDATNKNTDPCELEIFSENSDNTVIFDPKVNFNLSVRQKNTTKVAWNIPAGSWKTVGEAGADQRTPNLKTVIQEIVNRPNWAKGNALSLYITGKGVREAESIDGSPSQAPQIVIEYLSSSDSEGNPISDFPIKSRSSWSYFDQVKVDDTWKDTSYKELKKWAFGEGPLGYGVNEVVKKIGFGGDAATKNTTAYFVKRFNITDVAALPTNLELNLMCDDGAVVYINGTEVARKNLPTGAITATTLATKDVSGRAQTAYFINDIKKNVLVKGLNTIAVEVHQNNVKSDDLIFDLELKAAAGVTNQIALGCDTDTSHIACFTSLLPASQDQGMYLPNSHNFQLIVKSGTPYTKGTGSVGENNDFTGFIPENMTSIEKGHLSINHETAPGGVTMVDLMLDRRNGFWIVDTTQAISFEAPSISGTERLCSGGITPWGTVVTSEETMTAGDKNNDGYQDLGWNVEIDPETNSIVDYGNGKQEKLWAMGRMNHENIVIKSDGVTVYQGEDNGKGNVFKYIADKKGDLSKGKLYVLKLDADLVNNEPTSKIGTWVLVPNTTKDECNNVKVNAAALGGTFFNGIEDVEISPKDGMVYFTAKGNNRVYRFKDNGTTVADFSTFVGGTSYRLTTADGVVSESWGSGNDNLTFDDKGNLWVLQDGGRNHVWLVRPEHTTTAPKVELFMLTPLGSEPTGMTFTPDFKYMFMSIQSPAASNTLKVKDVAGNDVIFNNSVTMVIARKSSYKNTVSNNDIIADAMNLSIFPNPNDGRFNISFDVTNDSEASINIYDVNGRLVEKVASGNFAVGKNNVAVQSSLIKGIYFVQINVNQQVTVKKIVVQD